MNREITKYYQKGRNHLKNGEYKNAEEMFEKARELFLNQN
jgi:outer membrane protein assembly factor BamD (BamD/ComL family)